MTTFNAPPPNSDLPAMQQKLTARLARLGSRIRTQIALDAFVRCLAVVLGLLTLSLIVDFWLELSVPVRVIYWLVTLAAGAYLIYHYGLKPLRHRLGPIELAQAVDVAQGYTAGEQLAPRVATVLQLPAMFGNDEVLSGTMIRDAVNRSFHSLEDTDFTASLSGRHMMQCAGVLLASLILPTLVGGIMDRVGENVIGTWASRWLMLADTPYPRNTAIEVFGLDDQGRLVVPAGENFTFRAKITNKDQSDIEEARLVLTPDQGKKRTEPLAKFDASDFRLDMAPLTENASATVRAGDQTRTFEIVPAARPRLTGLKINYSHPSKPGETQTIDFNGAEGEVSLLELNDIELLLTANVPVAELRYVLDENRPADAQPMPPIARVNANTFSIKWTHKERQRFRIELIGQEASLVSQPIPISIGLKQDRKPTVRVRSTGVGPRITPNALIPLSEIEARDDLGLRELSLQFVRERVGGEESGRKDFDPLVLYQDDKALEQEIRDKREIEVDQFGVLPTDVLRITGIATDDRYVGRQTGESTTLTFRIVTDKELFREIIARQQQARAAFRQSIEDSKDLYTALAQAKTGIEVLAQDRRFRAIRREVWKVGNELGKSAEEMRLNRLGGTKEDGNQAYESMKSLILDPLEKLHSQSMELQLQAILAAGNAEPAKLAEIAQGQQNLINEMIDQLNKMDRWDELLDAINQLTEVIDQQQQIKKKVDELINEQIDDLFDN